jgi:processive 1,2-diacylglycerol beta-glucosyltransferase
MAAQARAQRRVLIFSAAVGEGHDAAARAVASQLRGAGADAEIVDGLELVGPRLAQFVIRAYGLQIRRAAWSWAILYAASRSRVVLRIAGCLLALYGGRRLLAAIERHRADCVVTTYPLISAALASLRRRGRLPVACASLITDFDPHPGWNHPDLDANLSVACGHGVTSIAPPLRFARAGGGSDTEARARLGVPPDARVALIAGGAWGVGNLRGAARAVSSLGGFHAVVVTGRNEQLRVRLARELAGRTVTVLGYVEGLGGLLGGADVVIQHAGGVTCLEAFAAERPVVMFDAVPGHGKRNARRMEAAGLATRARGGRALRDLLSSETYWRATAPAGVAAGIALFAHPEAADILGALAPRRLAAASSGLGRFWPVIGLAAAVAAALLLGTHPADPDLARWATRW